MTLRKVHFCKHQFSFARKSVFLYVAEGTTKNIHLSLFSTGKSSTYSWNVPVVRVAVQSKVLPVWCRLGHKMVAKNIKSTESLFSINNGPVWMTGHKADLICCEVVEASVIV